LSGIAFVPGAPPAQSERVPKIFAQETVMSQIHLAARLAQGLLAVTMVFAVTALVQISLVWA
jgi:hypothetical protein